MIGTILVPLDGSDLSRRALPYATALARATGARLVLMHAYTAKPEPPRVDGELDLVKEQADLASELRALGVHATTWLSYDDPGPAIVGTADDLRVGLIVMSTHGRGGLSQLVFGSVAEYVVRHAASPVLLVTERSRSHWRDDRPLRILVPLDGSRLAESALEPAGELASHLGAELLLVRVLESIDYVKPHGDSCEVCRSARARGEEPDIEPVRARKYVDAIVARLRSAGAEAHAEVHIGDARATIVKAARTHEVDLIAMATHGHGGLSRLVLGSVATDTLRQATAPVLLVRAAAEPESSPSAVTGGRRGESRPD